MVVNQNLQFLSNYLILEITEHFLLVYRNIYKFSQLLGNFWRKAKAHPRESMSLQPKINQWKRSTLSTWLKLTNEHETRALAVVNPGWFVSLESCSFARKFCTDFILSLSVSAVATGFQGMGRKTYLLSLLGLLLISCKCIFNFLFAFSFAQVSLKFCKLPCRDWWSWWRI